MMVAVYMLMHVPAVYSIEPGSEWQFIPEQVVLLDSVRVYTFPVDRHDSGYTFPFAARLDPETREPVPLSYLEAVSFEDEERLLVRRHESGAAEGVFYELNARRTEGLEELEGSGLRVFRLVYTNEDGEEQSLELYYDGEVIRLRERADYFDVFGIAEIIYRVRFSGTEISPERLDNWYQGLQDLLPAASEQEGDL